MSNALKLENTALGLELGSTRIKAVLIGPGHAVLAAGAHDWENRLEDGYWTYSLDDVWAGVQDAYAKLAAEFAGKYGMPLTSVGAMGVSAMMHGYLPFDAAGGQLAPFRTWRNTTTGTAAARLTELLGFNIPQRWSVAHLYQAMLNGEAHVKDIAFLTTLAGYVHWRLTGEKVLGVGEASGMFPIDSASCAYDGAMLAKFDALAQDMPWRLADILPRVLRAGEAAGALTAEGAVCWTRAAHCAPACRCARRRATRARAWPQRTAWPRARATCRRARRYSPCSCWKNRFQRSIRRSTWSRRRRARRWPWSTAIPAPRTWTPG